jgi:hypothetical protein
MDTALSKGTEMLAKSVIMDSRLRGNDAQTMNHIHRALASALNQRVCKGVHTRLIRKAFLHPRLLNQL